VEEGGRKAEDNSDFNDDFFLKTFLPKKDEKPALLFFLAETVATRATKKRIHVENFMVIPHTDIPFLFLSFFLSFFLSNT
jgi:hypothetical protein